MKIAIDNLGPIKHADIDLNKDLIILCGGNNSGKTYVAYSIYGLFKFREKYSFDIDNSFGLNDLSKQGSIDIDLGKLFISHKDKIIANLKENYIKSLSIVFASEQFFFENTRLDIELDIDDILEKLSESDVDMDGFGNDNEVFMRMVKADNSPILNITVIKESVELAIDVLKEIMYDVIFDDVHIETAERTAINLFSKEIAEKRTKLVDIFLDYDEKKDPLGFIKRQASRYSLPIRDSLYLAERRDVLQKQKSPFAYLADEIEKVILQGKIKVGKNGEMQFNPNKSKANLGIHLTASGVKSLASIIFYLRHIAQVGDFFIIDEPELNLHPDNQRKVARVIAQMVNAGIKVMLSTHSDYIIRELNNLIMLDVKGNDKVVNKLIKKYGYQKDQILNPEKVGVYLFTDKVEALEVNATGFEVKSIDDEINALNESAQDIFFTLHDN